MGATKKVEAGRLRALTLVGVALLSSSVLAGCANSARKVSQITTNAISRDAGRSLDTLSAPELAQAAQSTGQAYARDPKDRAIAMRYSTLLQMNGQSDQSLAVMRKLAIDYPKDREVLAAYGKALAAAGELKPGS